MAVAAPATACGLSRPVTLLSLLPLVCGCGSRLVLRLAARELVERPPPVVPPESAGRAGLAFPEFRVCIDARRDARFGVET
jgi:hypothetical protein